MRSESFDAQMGRLFPEEGNTVRTVTFQVTDDCTCACTYCYEIHKEHNSMSNETAQKIIDLLFQMYDEDDRQKPINKTTMGIILDFIGGEPLLNPSVIEFSIDYFLLKCAETDSPWIYRSRASICSNGSTYFSPEVQHLLQKHGPFISLTFTLDGPQEIHDACRVYHDGRGNFADAFAAMQDYNAKYGRITDTKVTLAPENLQYLNTIIDFFTSIGIKLIAANCTFEAEWTVDHAKLFYQQLKILADTLLKHPEYECTLFDDRLFTPLSPKENRNFCGGSGAMLAFDPKGNAYPCLRYTPSSIGEDQFPLMIGDYNGIYSTPYTKKIKEQLDAITRRSQSTDECFYCPVAAGCAWCSGWNFQLFGTPNKRCTRICIMHKARALANFYYWNKKYELENSNKYKRLYLPKSECLKIISEEEYNNLLLINKKNKEGN